MIVSRFLRSSLVVLAPLLLAPGARADEADTRLARQVHAEVNGRLDALARAAFSASPAGVDHQSDVKAWADTSGVRKIEVTDRDDSGEVVTEYFYAHGVLVFVYQATKGFSASGKQVTRIENREYFRSRGMFRWLGALDKENDPADPGFVEESRVRIHASDFYLRAARLEFSRRSSLCAPEEEVVFSCSTGEKRVSICASKDASRETGYLQYRYGHPLAPSDALEVALPATRQVPASAAEGENVAFSGGGGSWLRFRKAGHAFVAYSGIGKWGPKGERREKIGVTVLRGGKRIAVLKCDGKPETLPGADWFEKMGIGPRGEGFDFPD